MGPLTIEQVRRRFAERNLRFTRQREVIYRALYETNAHPTAEELYKLVHAAEPGVSLATIYNTLDALTAAGLVRRLLATHPAAPHHAAADRGDGEEPHLDRHRGGRGGGGCRYDADTTEHAHLIGADGRVHDVPLGLGEQAVASIPRELVCEIAERMGVKIDRIAVAFIEETSPHAGGHHFD